MDKYGNPLAKTVKLDSRKLDRDACSKPQARNLEILQIRRPRVGDARNWLEIRPHFAGRTQYAKFIGHRIEAHHIPLTPSIIQRRRTLRTEQKGIGHGLILPVALCSKIRTVLLEVIGPFMRIREWHGRIGNRSTPQWKRDQHPPMSCPAHHHGRIVDTRARSSGG
jgi:hypothetical protein